MGSLFSPTLEDVERYRCLRAVSRDLNNRMVRTIPARAFDQIGEALGVLHDGVLVLDTEDMSAVIADSCLNDWYEDGRNLVERYAEEHAAELEPDEAYLLNSYMRAEYRILMKESSIPGAGLYCVDVLNQQKLFLMDTAMSRSLSSALATRTIPLGQYWMTSGAGLPIATAETVDAIERIGAQAHLLQDKGHFELAIIRACLDGGAAERVRYASPREQARKRREPRLFTRRHRRT